VWRPVPDDFARAAGILTGEYDIATNVPTSMYKSIEESARAGTVSVSSSRIFTILLSTRAATPGPIHDKRVRQALNYAIDKQSIVENLLDGHAQLLHGQVLKPDQLGYNSEVDDYQFDPAKAKALLAESGLANGMALEFKASAGRYANDREVGQAIANMLGDVGIDVNLSQLEPGEFLRQMNAGELVPAAMVGYAAANDPDPVLANYSSAGRYSTTENAGLDKLIEEGSREMDPEKRAAIYRSAMKLMHDEALAVFLYAPDDIYGKSDRVEGFRPHADQRWTIYGMSIKE
jgi:peptide/nickel transport system substrate-binding protein